MHGQSCPIYRDPGSCTEGRRGGMPGPNLHGHELFLVHTGSLVGPGSRYFTKVSLINICLNIFIAFLVLIMLNF